MNLSPTTAVSYTLALGSAAVAAFLTAAYLFQEKLLYMRDMLRPRIYIKR